MPSSLFVSAVCSSCSSSSTALQDISSSFGIENVSVTSASHSLGVSSPYSELLSAMLLCMSASFAFSSTRSDNVSASISSRCSVISASVLEVLSAKSSSDSFSSLSRRNCSAVSASSLSTSSGCWLGMFVGC
ncbi:hypothetical protein HMPREF6745_2267 [Prevotella sp. oral taxon 472 str. F0295]|nr:hypothetical protein HMPREF6745_2267 [Prevotella sp. oral taxon 472 str. F0295]